MPRQYGHITGVSVGTVFRDRKALAKSGVHPPNMAGISGAADGCDSIVLNGGYIDDVDNGDVIIYTGQGGNDLATKKQIADQQLTRGNLGLAHACTYALPVRVTRGPKCDSSHRCPNGYRYDGLYLVESHWRETGRDGFKIHRFRLVALPIVSEPIVSMPTDSVAASAAGPAPAGNLHPSAARQTVVRVIRDTKVSRHVKALHRDVCQVCGAVLEVPGGRYSEAAHIRPLGRPHNGPDVVGNVLCLCPNHHVLFDRGSLYVDAANLVQPLGTPLRMRATHQIDATQLSYHRKHFGNGV